MTNESALVGRLADRVRALIRHCPVDKTLKMRDGDRFAECTHTTSGARLTLKLSLRSDVTGAALLHAIFRIAGPTGSGRGV